MKTEQLTAEDTLADEITMHDLTCYGREFNLTRSQLSSVLSAMKMYALQCCQKVRQDCADNATIARVTAYPKYPTIDVKKFKTHTSSIIGVVETLTIDKQSILDTEINLP